MLSKATIKDIQSLQQKKFRDIRNEFTAEGPKVVGELLKSRAFPLKMLYALPEWTEQMEPEIRSLTKDRLEEVTPYELEKIAGYATPNLVVAVFEKKQTITQVNPIGKITLVLDDIRDPGNLGTIIRTADWFGLTDIVCSLQTVDMYNSKVVQSTMASLARVNMVYTSLEDWLGLQAGIPVLATTTSGMDIAGFSKIKEAIVLIGNESSGLSESLLQMASDTVSIPGSGNAESLNAAIATGIILYALKG